MPRQLLYATTNPGKAFEVRKILESVGITLHTPLELALLLDVPETGATLEENASRKAQAYLKALASSDYVIMADDTGVEIDALNGEPGVQVRRWIGRRMTDQEIIDYCLTRMAHLPPGQRGAQFRTVIALGVPGGEIELFDGTLRGEILEQPEPLRIEGFPFESIFFVPEWDLVLGAVHQLPAAQKTQFITHRERTITRALPRIRQLLES
jgi:XTP/dITP diphosphohydrolase